MRECIRTKKVWSPKNRKYVERCAEYATDSSSYDLDLYGLNDSMDDLGYGGDDDIVLEFEGGGLGQMANPLATVGLTTQNLKDAVTTGGVAAAGAWGVSKLTKMVIDKFPTLASFDGLPEIVNLLLGVMAGGLVSRFYRPRIGANLMIGPATISALSILNLTNEVMGLPSGGNVAGMLPRGNQLGIMTANRAQQFTERAEPPVRSYSVGGQTTVV